jgi:hypothetical protein
MKACGYCGREDDDSAAHCRECGTAFATATDASGSVLQTLNTPAGLVATGALGTLLVATALFFVIGRAFVELRILPGLPPAADYGTMYSFFTSVRPAPFIALLVIVPAFLVCRARCSTRRIGTAAAVLTAGAICVLAVLPRFVPRSAELWCLPAMVLGDGGASSVGCYVGAGLQLVLGSWLLIWFRTRDPKEERRV